MTAIQELFNSIGNITVYKRGFDDGVDAVAAYLKTSMAQKSVALCQELGLDPNEWKLDPVNGQFVSNKDDAVVDTKDAPSNKLADHQATMLDQNARLIAAVKAQAAELEALKSSNAKPARKEAPKARTNVVGAQPLSLPDPLVPLASSLEQKIDNQVDKQIEDVLKSIKARNQ